MLYPLYAVHAMPLVVLTRLLSSTPYHVHGMLGITRPQAHYGPKPSTYTFTVKMYMWRPQARKNLDKHQINSEKSIVYWIVTSGKGLIK